MPGALVHVEVDVGAEGLLESVHASVACLWVAVVSLVDEDAGGIVGVVGVADGTSELSSAGSRVAVGMLVHSTERWPW